MASTFVVQAGNLSEWGLDGWICGLLSARLLFRRNSARDTLLYAVTTVRVFQILQFDVHVTVHR